MHAFMLLSFLRNEVDGNILSRAEKDDFLHEDYPLAKPMHWKVLWRRIEIARTDGVDFPGSCAAPSLSVQTAPALKCVCLQVGAVMFVSPVILFLDFFPQYSMFG